MRVARWAWVVAVVVAAGLALLVYSQTRPKEVHTVALRWTESPHATSYNIYRATVSGGPYTQIGNVDYPVYLDIHVSSGSVYYYVVTALTGWKESGYSKEMSATVP
jgi:fibronectin type 3 domain-containing protein